MPEAALMLYPRGFYGGISSPSTEKQPKPFASKVARLQNNLNFLQGLRPGVRQEVNEKVEDLYRQLITREGIDKMIFRRKVLQTALTAFGTHRFDYWYSQQMYSPAAGDLHRDFLVDTLRFISTGERHVNVMTWNSLIGFSDQGERVSVLDEYAKEFFGISTGGFNRIPRNNDLIDVIRQWCSQPGGLSDLLCTMHILFGAQ